MASSSTGPDVVSRGQGKPLARHGFAIVDLLSRESRRQESDVVAPKTVMERVEKLEQTVESLVALPGVVADLAVRTGNLESQFVQLRSEKIGRASCRER